MVDISPFTDRVNLVCGAIIALLSYIFGEHWFLFAAYLGLNALDFITRWITARILCEENSKAGLNGIIKKLGYWVMIVLAFTMGAIFVELGKVLGMDLTVTTYLGWFALAALIINEIRSILENLVEGYGDKVPKVLVKGLKAANKVIEDAIDDDAEE